jgi:hypothetical protein
MTTVHEIAVSLGRPFSDVSEEQQAQWEMWISEALVLIEDRLGDPSLLDQDKLDLVVRRAVKAMVLRPDNATTVDIAIDDGRISKRYSSGKGDVTIRDDWWALLGATRTRRAFSVDTIPETVCS